jgi:hypothetical protein
MNRVQTPAQWLASLPDDRRTEARQLAALLRAAARVLDARRRQLARSSCEGPRRSDVERKWWRVTRTRAIVVLLLVGGGVWAAGPWAECAMAMYLYDRGLQACTFGLQATYGRPVPGPSRIPDWGFWPNVLAAVAYFAVAVFLTRRRGPV